MRKYLNPDKDKWTEIMERPVFNTADIVPKVSEILSKIKQNGDKALREYALKFDGFAPEKFIVNDKEFNEAIENVEPELKIAIQDAANNIERFHTDQLSRVVRTETVPGVTCWQKSVPIQSVGLYVPGGTAPLFSTVLMLGIPASIARCPEVVLCTPAGKDGKINPAILYAARLCGIDKVFKIGGAQAIGAMAYGTESVPKVNKIFGPGNQFVTTAKKLVSSEGVAIDMPAGPSEVLVVADETTPEDFAAADLLSQAEHGTDSQVILLSTNKNKLAEIEKETLKQLKELPRKDIAEKSLNNSRLVYIDNQKLCYEFINKYAPEHLILAVDNPDPWANEVTQAGSVFMGIYSPESAGDYASGTNHTLPTNGFASAYSGVNLDSFVKKITFQKLTGEGIKNIGKTIEIMAEAEQLFAHKNAVSVRLKSLKDNE